MSMRHFWTFQRTELVKKLLESGTLANNFYTNKIVGISSDAYHYILNIYNIETGSNYTGLIFGIVGGSGTEPYQIDTKDKLYDTIEKAGDPGGSTFSKQTHKLLHLLIPDNIHIMEIDFYRFSDLLYLMSQYGESDKSAIANSDAIMNDLFKPNGINDSWELIVGHIPLIKKSWVKEILTPRD